MHFPPLGGVSAVACRTTHADAGVGAQVEAYEGWLQGLPVLGGDGALAVDAHDRAAAFEVRLGRAPPGRRKREGEGDWRQRTRPIRHHSMGRQELSRQAYGTRR